VAIERVVAGGDGLAREQSGRVVFVPGTLPGEVVDVEITTAKRDFARGRLVEVVEASPDRRAAPCAALARGCGGCDWQHVDPSAQLDLKAEIVREALRRTARLDRPTVVSGGRVDPHAYRTSLRLALDREGRPGLRRERSNESVALDDCLVAHPALAAMLPGLRIAGADEVSLRVSAATGGATAWWTPEPARALGLPPAAATGRSASLIEVVRGTRLRVTAESFFQSGPAAAELLVDTVSDVAGDELTGATRVVDAYGGVGLFAATITPPAADVVVVEGSGSSCADARVNLAGRRASVVETAVEDWVATSADVVIADPSRHGLGEGAVRALGASRAPLLILVSCDPVSLARDTTLLAAQGFEHRSTTVVDLFPHTHHVEAVTRFAR
jgi:23S rRNA (uracil1939-C5)-methyltransferase